MKSTAPWKPPPIYWLKTNIYAAIVCKTNIAGVSMVIRDSSGTFVETMVNTIKTRDVKQAKTPSLLKSINLVKAANIKQVITEGRQ